VLESSARIGPATATVNIDKQNPIIKPLTQAPPLSVLCVTPTSPYACRSQRFLLQVGEAVNTPPDPQNQPAFVVGYPAHHTVRNETRLVSEKLLNSELRIEIVCSYINKTPP